MEERKRSKRHRRQRNHINAKSHVDSNMQNVQWAQEVHRAYRKKFRKGEYSPEQQPKLA